MSEAGATGLLRAEASPQRATFLELFLDLVFVFALTRVSQRLILDFTTERRILLPEAGQTLLLFLALWLVWATTAYATSRLEPEAQAVQVVVFMTMVGSMVMAVALPRAFAERALVFVGAYVTVQLGRTLYLVLATRGQADPTDPTGPLRILCWSGVAAVPWLIGGMAGESPTRGVLWTLALVVDYVGLILGWPVFKRGRSRLGGQAIAGEHLAERYQQFLLIALGESILVIGIAFSTGPGFVLDRTVGGGLALLTTVLFFRIYFYQAGQVLPSAITRARQPARLGIAAGYTHLIMIAGIVLTGVGHELYITHPLEHNEPPWLFAILGGPALFLVGRGFFEFQVFARISRSRLVGVLALGALIAPMLYLPPLAIAGAAAAVLFGVASSDARRARGRAVEEPTPPI